jgi:sugar O-acyltransferase (sialic acid O-acetyltransferase NeuD family)
MGSQKKLIVLGAGGHGLSVLDAAVSAGYTPVGLMDSHLQGSSAHGFPLLRSFDGVDFSEVEIGLGIGHNFAREAAFLKLRQQFPKAHFPSIVHATAWVSPTASLAEGSVVLAHASVGPMAVVGAGAILNTGATLDHESRLSAFASLSPGAHTGGKVTIGERAMVGLNAGLLQGTTIGEDTVIGAHSLVRSDVAPLMVAYGVPCVEVRSRGRDDTYL